MLRERGRIETPYFFWPSRRSALSVWSGISFTSLAPARVIQRIRAALNETTLLQPQPSYRIADLPSLIRQDIQLTARIRIEHQVRKFLLEGGSPVWMQPFTFRVSARRS